MTEELDLVVTHGPHPIHVRVRAGLRKSKNWRQLAKFCIVGGSGYVVNLCVFAFVFEVLNVHHLIAATITRATGIRWPCEPTAISVDRSCAAASIRAWPAEP